jgi:hypothetical protein
VREQLKFCEAVVTDLVRVFPGYHPTSFTTNAASCNLGHLLTVTVPPEIARKLLDAFEKSLMTDRDIQGMTDEQYWDAMADAQSY